MNAHLPEPIARFDDAQRRAFALLGDVVRRLEPGMSERDVFELAETRLQPNGFETWYHPPEVGIGRSGGWWPASARRTLTPGDLVTLDVGPAVGDAYGDAGVTVCFGGNEPPQALAAARACLQACCGYSSRWKTIGEIYIFAKAWAVNRRMALVNRRAIGHRLVPREGWVRTGWPRSAHLATLLGRNRMHRLNPVRMDGLFAIRPEISVDGQTASFEEVVYVHEDTHVVLGRDSMDEIGTI